MKCKFCDATVKDDKDKTLAAAQWGWVLAPDPGLGYDHAGPIPGWWYACPDCSDEDHRDAFALARKQPSPPTNPQPETGDGSETIGGGE